MGDATTLAVVAVAGLSALLILIAALLQGWRGWLDLKREELTMREAGPATPSPGARIALADLKERVRRLEAIANGVE